MGLLTICPWVDSHFSKTKTFKWIVKQNAKKCKQGPVQDGSSGKKICASLAQIASIGMFAAGFWTFWDLWGSLAQRDGAYAMKRLSLIMSQAACAVVLRGIARLRGKGAHFLGPGGGSAQLAAQGAPRAPENRKKSQKIARQRGNFF